MPPNFQSEEGDDDEATKEQCHKRNLMKKKRGNGHNMNLPLNWTCQPHKFPDKNLSDFIEDKGLIIYSNSPVINCCVSVTVNFDVVFLYVLYQSYNCTYFWGAAVFLDA